MAEGCKITKTKDGKINGVLDQSGNKSRLFKEIFNVPTLNLDEAIKTYQNIYSEELKDSVTIAASPGIRFSKSSAQESTVEVNEAKTAFNQEVDFAKENAEEYKKSKGIKGLSHLPVYEINEDMSKEISEAYDQMQDNYNQPEVKASYDAMIEETVAQYDFIVGKGLKVEKSEGMEEPYTSSAEMLKDLRDNNSMKFLPNSVAFEQDSKEVKNNPALAPSGRFIEGGYELTNSEVFRVVHDYFGHGILGNQFGAVGEENATLQHLDLFSDLAAPAVIAQTRGQNSWVNFSGVNDEAKNLRNQAKEEKNINKSKELVEKANRLFKFAQSKIGILPSKYNFKKYGTANRVDNRTENENSNVPKTLAEYNEQYDGARGVIRRNGEGVREIGGVPVEIISEYELESVVEEGIKKAFPKFKGTQVMYEITDGEFYRNRMLETLKQHPHSASVTLYSAEDFNEMRMFVTEDGSTGITLTKEGFLGGAFSDPNSGRPNNLAQLMVLGIKEGATTGEAFHTILPDYYANFGFRAVAKLEFDEELKPMIANGAMKDWNVEDYIRFNNGRPDLVFIVFDGGSRDTIEERLGQFDNYNYYDSKITPLVNSYKEGKNITEATALQLITVTQSEVEPSLTFETPKGETFNNYADALKATAEGMIKLKIAGVDVGEVNSDTNINTYHGVLNHFIKSGVLTGDRMLDTNGDEILVVSGGSFQSKNLTVDIVEEVATKLLGASNVQVLTTGDIILKNTLNTRIINGETVTDKEVAEMTYEQMKRRFGEEVALTNEISKAVSLSLQPNFAKKRIDEDIEIKTDSELNIAIKSLLNKMGIKVTSLENYLKGNEARNGVPITANALMDVVNKVMAFRDGTITQEDLIEETMHLIEATLDPTLTAGVRKNIHKTAEWSQFEAQYRVIYSKEYSGEQLEEVIRREILGKVMANAVANNFALSQNATLTQQSIYGRIRELLQDFFNKIENFFKPEYLQQIDKLNSDIYAKLMTEDLANELNFNDSYGSKLVLFSTSTGLGSELVQLEKSAREALRVIEFQTNAIGKNDASQKNKVRSANESMSKVRENFQILKEAKLAQSELELAEVKARAELQAVFSIIVNVAQKQAAYLKRAVKKNAQSSYPFSSEEMGVFGTLVGQLDKAILPSMQKRLKETEFKSEAETKLLNEITKTLQDITDLKAEVGSLDIDANEKITQMLKKRLNLNDEKTDFVRQKLAEQRKESSWFFLQFGTLLHSSNILLNAAGNVITKSTDESNRGTLEDVQPFVESVGQTGYLGTNAKELVRDGYLQNRFNDKIREEALLDKRFELYQKYDNTLTKEDFSKKESFTNLTSEQRLEFERDFTDWQLKEVNLSAFKPDVQLERKNRLMKYSLSTQRFERDSSADYNLIMQEADEVEIVDKNGDKQTVLTFNQDMKLRLEQAKKRRVQEKNLFRQDGTLETGLEFTTEDQYNADKVSEKVENQDVLFEGDTVAYGDNLFIKIDRTRADNNTVLSFELNQIDNRRVQEMKSKDINIEKLSEKFKGAMEATDPMDVYDFLTINAYIGYNQEYYDTFESSGLSDRLEASKDGENDSDIDEILSKIATLKKQQKLVMQANRDLKRPSETNYSEMDVAELKSVLDTETRLESLYKEANSFLSKKEVEEIERENISETVFNRAFQNYMSDSRGVKGTLLFEDKTRLDSIELESINQIFRAVADHSTTNTNDRVSSLKGTIREVSSGRRNKLSKSEARVFSKTIEEYSEMSEEEIFASMTNDLLKYSYSKLLPYFKKSRPIGADLALEDLEAGIITGKEFLDKYDNGEYQYLQISPNYTFQEANEDANRDVHYQRAKDNFTPMFRTFEANATEQDMRTKSIDQLKSEGKFNQYVNTDFLKEYDIDMVTLFNTGKEVARANLKKFDARQAFLDLQKKTLANADKLGRHNLYLLPQKEKGLLRKGEDILKSGKNVKGMLSELVKYREDDADLGKDADGATTNMGVSKIPIYGFRKLTESEATDEILESYIWMNKESNLYKSRLKNIGDMFTIKEALLNDGMGQNLGIMATNTYKMFEDAMNYNFYGIKEVFSKEFEVFGVQMDAGKMLRNFGKLIRIRNLGFTVISPITSAITGYVSANFIEKMVGESVDKDAMTAGYKFFRRTSGDAMREVAGLQGKSELNAIGSRWGFFEFDDRFKNSGFGKKVRVLGQSVFAAHQMANFPVNTPVGLSVLADHKFVDGQIIRFRNYKENNKGVPEKELRKEWENYLSILDATLVDKNGVVGYDYPKIMQSLNSNATIEEVENLIEESSGRIRGVVKMAIQRTDGQIATEDKATASRNAIMSFIGIHRNWLFLAASYKFKGRQLSTATGEYEEGSWKNTARFVSEVFKEAKNGKSMQLLAQIKKSWNDTDDLTRTNVKRTAIEMAVLNATIALMMGLMSLSGDDKEEDAYALKIAQLFSMRLANEISSSTVGLPKNLYDTLDGLVVGLNTLNVVTDAPKILSSDIIERGRYKGLTEREKYFYQNIVISREYYNLIKNIDGNIASYKFFNFTKGGAGDYTMMALTPEPEK